MKAFLIFLFATLLAAFSLSAKNLSLREKRPAAKTRFKIDPTIIDETVPSETISNEIKPEKTLRSNVQVDKTIRANKLGRESILKQTPAPQRRKGNFREWP